VLAGGGDAALIAGCGGAAGAGGAEEVGFGVLGLIVHASSSKPLKCANITMYPSRPEPAEDPS